MSSAALEIVANPVKEAPVRKRFHQVLDPRLLAVALSEDGTIEAATPALRKALEYGQGQPMVPNFFSHVHSKNLYRIMRDMAEMVTRGRAEASWLLRLRTAQGRWRWFNATVRNELDKTPGAVVIVLQNLC